MFKVNDTAVPKCFCIPDLTVTGYCLLSRCDSRTAWNADLGSPNAFQYPVIAGIKKRHNNFHCNREINPDVNICIHKTARRIGFGW